MLINYNGKLMPSEAVPPFVDGTSFRFRKGLFETLLITGGKVQLTLLHFQRLQRGCAQERIALPDFFSSTFLEQEIFKSIPHLDSSWRVRLQVCMESLKFSYLIEAAPVDETTFLFNSTGWKLGIASSIETHEGSSGNLKRINIDYYKMNTEEASAKDVNDLLIVRGDKVVETGIGNIFWVEKGQIFTPPLSDGCVDGVMRRFIINQLTGIYKVREESCSVSRLLQSEELFLTNAIRRIKWISNLDGTLFPDCKISANIVRKLFP